MGGDADALSLQQYPPISCKGLTSDRGSMASACPEACNAAEPASSNSPLIEVGPALRMIGLAELSVVATLSNLRLEALTGCSCGRPVRESHTGPAQTAISRSGWKCSWARDTQQGRA